MNGDDGITEEFLIMREMTNLEIVNIYEGTANLHPLILDRARTSLQAF
jgi:glutaryl-CoA dehydrogenase